MNNKAIIVSGEASETDSDDDTLRGTLELIDTRASVIQGEDSESDQEVAPKPEEVRRRKVVKDEYADSLLHKKLRECNSKLHRNINHLADAVLGDSHKTLSNVEQDLLRCQLIMQSAVSSLQNLTSNSDKIKSKLDGIVSSSFLSTIKI